MRGLCCCPRRTVDPRLPFVSPLAEVEVVVVTSLGGGGKHTRYYYYHYYYYSIIIVIVILPRTVMFLPFFF